MENSEIYDKYRDDDDIWGPSNNTSASNISISSSWNDGAKNNKPLYQDRAKSRENLTYGKTQGKSFNQRSSGSSNSNKSDYRGNQQNVNSRRGRHKSRNQDRNNANNQQQLAPQWIYKTDEDAVDAPPPAVNVWEVRKARMDAIAEMQPHSNREEEAMIRTALELSRQQAVEDEQRRKEQEEEYFLDLDYSLQNRNLNVPDNNKQSFKYDSRAGISKESPFGQNQRQNDRYYQQDDKSVAYGSLSAKGNETCGIEWRSGHFKATQPKLSDVDCQEDKSVASQSLSAKDKYYQTGSSGQRSDHFKSRMKDLYDFNCHEDQSVASLPLSNVCYRTTGSEHPKDTKPKMTELDCQEDKSVASQSLIRQTCGSEQRSDHSKSRMADLYDFDDEWNPPPTSCSTLPKDVNSFGDNNNSVIPKNSKTDSFHVKNCGDKKKSEFVKDHDEDVENVPLENKLHEKNSVLSSSSCSPVKTTVPYSPQQSNSWVKNVEVVTKSVDQLSLEKSSIVPAQVDEQDDEVEEEEEIELQFSYKTLFQKRKNAMMKVKQWLSANELLKVTEKEKEQIISDDPFPEPLLDDAVSSNYVASPIKIPVTLPTTASDAVSPVEAAKGSPYVQPYNVPYLSAPSPASFPAMVAQPFNPSAASAMYWQQAVMYSNPMLYSHLQALQSFYISQGIAAANPFMLMPMANTLPYAAAAASYPMNTAGPNLAGYQATCSGQPSSSPGISPPTAGQIRNPVEMPLESGRPLGSSISADSQSSSFPAYGREDFVGIAPPKPPGSQSHDVKSIRQPRHTFSDIYSHLQNSSSTKDMP